MAVRLGQIKSAVLGLLPDSWMIVRGSTPGTIHLTYDDGPDPDVTPGLLALLRERNAKATFFLLGKNAKEQPALVKQMAAEGHALGNHSFFHTDFHKMPLARQMREVRDTNALLQDLTGQPCHLFRAPAGKLSAQLFLELIGERITYVNWSRDTLDYSLQEAAVIAELKRTPIKDRDIVLLHDDHRKVIGITEHILTQYSNFRFTGVQG